MLIYIVYMQIGHMYVRTEKKIKVREPLQLGKTVTYNQYGITRATVSRCVFCQNEFRVYLTK